MAPSSEATTSKEPTIVPETEVRTVDDAAAKTTAEPGAGGSDVSTGLNGVVNGVEKEPSTTRETPHPESSHQDEPAKHSSNGTVPAITQADPLAEKQQKPESHSKTTAEKSTARKPSFLSTLLRILVPCVGPSRSHSIQVDDHLPETKAQPVTEKQPSVSVKEAPQKEATPIATETEKAAPTEPEKTPEKLSIPEPIADLPLTVIPTVASSDPDVLLPPTPTSQLLPKAETEGVTSGAVQPPGSTGGSATNSVHEHRNHESTTPASATDGEESDGTSYTDEDLDESNQMDDIDEEEDRLINNGGAGIPIGPDGIPKPLLPPISPQHAGRKCLVLDLDETLVHSSFKSIQQADYVVPVEIEYHWHNVYVIKRPGVDNFLKKMGEIYEIVVFTASLSKYADPVLDKLDIHQVVSHRLFRESCYNHKGNYVKDLSQLGRPIADTIILDNSPASYIFHPNNAVPVSSWFNDPHDTELTDLVPFLADLSPVDDVRGVLDGAR